MHEKYTTRYAIKDYHQVISLAILATLTDKSYVGEQRQAGRPARSETGKIKLVFSGYRGRALTNSSQFTRYQIEVDITDNI